MKPGQMQDVNCYAVYIRCIPGTLPPRGCGELADFLSTLCCCLRVLHIRVHGDLSNLQKDQSSRHSARCRPVSCHGPCTRHDHVQGDLSGVLRDSRTHSSKRSEWLAQKMAQTVSSNMGDTHLHAQRRRILDFSADAPVPAGEQLPTNVRLAPTLL